MTRFFFPSDRPSIGWRTMHAVQKLYQPIPHTFCLMTFDLRGQIRPLRPKQKFKNQITQELCKISTKFLKYEL